MGLYLSTIIIFINVLNQCLFLYFQFSHLNCSLHFSSFVLCISYFIFLQFLAFIFISVLV